MTESENTEAVRIATMADGKAEAAISAIRSHEDRCAERWAEARNELRALATDIKGFRGLFITGLMAVIASLGGSVVWLLLNGSPWVHAT